MPAQAIHPTAQLAPRALLPGDPGRALALAQQLLDAPLMFNHNRGLWGYTGTASDGQPLTIQSTGVGGPSAAMVLEELCDLGLELAIRVGTCTARNGDLALGDLFAVRAAHGHDGTSRALGAGPTLSGDTVLTDALRDATGREGDVASHDLFYARDSDAPTPGVIADDLDSAAVLAVASRRGIRAGCVLAATTARDGERLDADGRAAAGAALGTAAATALGL